MNAPQEAKEFRPSPYSATGGVTSIAAVQAPIGPRRLSTGSTAATAGSPLVTLRTFAQALHWGDWWVWTYREHRRAHLRELEELHDRIWHLETKLLVANGTELLLREQLKKAGITPWDETRGDG